MSCGQQKLLELAGVLMGEPDTILLDEPAGGVNPALLDRIGTLVRELNAEGRTFVIVEHNMEHGHEPQATTSSSSTAAVRSPRGRPSVMQTDPRVLGAYLGV